MSPTGAATGTGRARHLVRNTSRTSTGAATLSRLALSGFAAAGLGFAWAASGTRGEQRGDPRANRVLTVPPHLPGRRRGRRRRFTNVRNRELRLEQRAERVAQQLLRLLRRRIEESRPAAR